MFTSIKTSVVLIVIIILLKVTIIYLVKRNFSLKKDITAKTRLIEDYKIRLEMVNTRLKFIEEIDKDLSKKIDVENLEYSKSLKNFNEERDKDKKYDEIAAAPINSVIFDILCKTNFFDERSACNSQ